MQELEANAIATIMIGPFVDMTDGVTPEEGVTLAAADSAEVMKHNGTTFVDIAGAGGNQATLTHKEKGMYTLAIPAAVISDEGRLTVFISDESVCLPVWKDFMVVSQAYWASKYDAKDSGYMDVDIKAVGGTATPHTSGKLHILNGDGAAITAVGPTKTEMDNAIATIIADTEDLQTILGTPANFMADLSTLETRLSATRAGYLDELDFGLTEALAAISGYVDCLPAALGDIVTQTEAHVVDAVWDEALTGAAHNGATTAGRRLRQAADVLIAREETCQAGGDNDEVIFDASASAVDDFYKNDIVILISGTGVGQSRHIDSYVGSTKTATVNRDWTTNPDETTGYVIRFDSTKHVHGFDTTAKAEIESEVADALDAVIPESPTAHSINERIKSMDILTEANGDGDLAAVLVDVTGLNGMTPPTAVQIQTEMEADGASILDTLQDRLTSTRAGYLDQLDFTLQEAIAAIKAETVLIVEDTGSTLPTTLSTIAGYTDLIDDVTNGLVAIKAEVEGLGGAAMVGTNGAALASSWSAALATALANYNSTRAGYLDQLDFALQEAIAAIPTTAMRGTDNVVLAGPTKAQMDAAHALLATPAQVATALTTYDGPTEAEMNTAHALLATPAQVVSALDTYDAVKRSEATTDKNAIITQVNANETKIDDNKAILDKLDSAMEADGAVSRFTENALEEAPSGTGASAATIADAVWDEAIADHQAEGSTGEALTGATKITLEED